MDETATIKKPTEEEQFFSVCSQLPVEGRLRLLLAAEAIVYSPKESSRLLQVSVASQDL